MSDSHYTVMKVSTEEWGRMDCDGRSDCKSGVHSLQGRREGGERGRRREEIGRDCNKIWPLRDLSGKIIGPPDPLIPDPLILQTLL